MSRGNHLPAGAMLFAPVQMAEKFPGHRLVARSGDPSSFQELLGADGLKRVEYLQLTNLDADPGFMPTPACLTGGRSGSAFRRQTASKKP
jgi:hypothetical protein